MKIKMRCSQMNKHPSGQWMVTFEPTTKNMVTGEDKTLYVIDRDDIEVGNVYEGYSICDMFIPISLVITQ